MDTNIYIRFSEEHRLEAIQDTPVILIQGSRQCGQPPLARNLGQKLGNHYIRFDDYNQWSAAHTDPVDFLIF